MITSTVVMTNANIELLSNGSNALDSIVTVLVVCAALAMFVLGAFTARRILTLGRA